MRNDQVHAKCGWRNDNHERNHNQKRNDNQKRDANQERNDH